MTGQSVILVLYTSLDREQNGDTKNGVSEMKTTIEIPDDLFRQAKVLAALQGIRLRELVEYGLRLAIETPPAPASGQRTDFPLIKPSDETPSLTDEQVAAALTEMEEEDAQRHAGFVRY
jgi:hypothetical protein